MLLCCLFWALVLPACYVICLYVGVWFAFISASTLFYCMKLPVGPGIPSHYSFSLLALWDCFGHSEISLNIRQLFDAFKISLHTSLTCLSTTPPNSPYATVAKISVRYSTIGSFENGGSQKRLFPSNPPPPPPLVILYSKFATKNYLLIRWMG